MRLEPADVTWVESRPDYSIVEVGELSGLPAALIDGLVDSGALPVTDTQMAVRFAAESVMLACAAQRLRTHFELDEQGLAVAVSLLRRVRVLEAQVSGLRAESIAATD